MKKSDESMRVYESANDPVVLPQNYIVVRLDGQHFHTLTRDLKLEKPFSEPFRDWMASTTRHLMEHSGFNIRYGYTQSDEISLLFDLDDDTFSRRQNKIMTVLAGKSSSHMSMLLGSEAVFDARISILPNIKLVQDYFVWRQEDSARNSLNGYAFWKLVESGKSRRVATTILEGVSAAWKNEYLFEHHQINWNNTPTWQRRGLGFYWQKYQKTGFNPIKQESVIVERKTLFTDFELPMGEIYEYLVQDASRGLA